MIDGIQIIECPFLEPGKAYLINPEVFRSRQFQIADPYKDRLQEMRASIYLTKIIPITPHDAAMILDSDRMDWRQPWSPRKSRGPRRKSRRNRP